MSSKQSSIKLVWIPVCLGLTHLTLQVNLLQPFFVQYRWAHTFIVSLVGTLVSMMLTWNFIKTPLKFMYSCFFKPLGKHDNQQNRLESFYQDQATSNKNKKLTCFFIFFNFFSFFSLSLLLNTYIYSL